MGNTDWQVARELDDDDDDDYQNVAYSNNSYSCHELSLVLHWNKTPSPITGKSPLSSVHITFELYMLKFFFLDSNWLPIKG